MGNPIYRKLFPEFWYGKGGKATLYTALRCAAKFVEGDEIMELSTAYVKGGLDEGDDFTLYNAIVLKEDRCGSLCIDDDGTSLHLVEKSDTSFTI